MAKPTAAWWKVARSRSAVSRSASFAATRSCSARRRAARMLCAFCSATARSSSSSPSGSRDYLPARTRDASAVPATRARILANAVARVVEVSSQKGE